MKTLILTNEYPPFIYGGAGVHVDHLSRALAQFCEVDVRCFGNQRVSSDALTATGYTLDTTPYKAPKALHPVFSALQRGLDFNTTGIDADLVHAHTWYAHFGAIVAKLNYSIPMIITVHSLEPLRPWKREQLGGGYDFTCWIEKTAIEMADGVIAVSQETKNDIVRLFAVDANKVHVIHNGIDPEEYRPTHAPHLLQPLGIDPNKPYTLFVGRITKQKGILHMIKAVRHMDRAFQVVIAARAPDTAELEAEVNALIAQVQRERPGVFWIRNLTDTPTKVALYSHAAVFCCPSIYEPFGIINLEAMACEVPVVASAVGGIKEVVVDGVTGLLVPVARQPVSPFEPIQPEQFEKDIAAKVNLLMRDKDLRTQMGKQGRRRVIEAFSWHSIAEKTYQLYRSYSHARK